MRSVFFYITDFNPAPIVDHYTAIVSHQEFKTPELIAIQSQSPPVNDDVLMLLPDFTELTFVKSKTTKSVTLTPLHTTPNSESLRASKSRDVYEEFQDEYGSGYRPNYHRNRPTDFSSSSYQFSFEGAVSGSITVGVNGTYVYVAHGGDVPVRPGIYPAVVCYDGFSVEWVLAKFHTLGHRYWELAPVIKKCGVVIAGSVQDVSVLHSQSLPIGQPYKQRCNIV